MHAAAISEGNDTEWASATAAEQAALRSRMAAILDSE